MTIVVKAFTNIHSDDAGIIAAVVFGAILHRHGDGACILSNTFG
jgi:hypothetical protein